MNTFRLCSVLLVMHAYFGFISSTVTINAGIEDKSKWWKIFAFWPYYLIRGISGL